MTFQRIRETGKNGHEKGEPFVPHGARMPITLGKLEIGQILQDAAAHGHGSSEPYRIRLSRRLIHSITRGLLWGGKAQERKRGYAHHVTPWICLAGSKGLEPSASGVTGRRYNQLNYDPACWWWAEQGSNLRPSACKADALPAELSALVDTRLGQVRRLPAQREPNVTERVLAVKAFFPAFNGAGSHPRADPSVRKSQAAARFPVP